MNRMVRSTSALLDTAAARALANEALDALEAEPDQTAPPAIEG